MNTMLYAIIYKFVALHVWLTDLNWPTFYIASVQVAVEADIVLIALFALWRLLLC